MTNNEKVMYLGPTIRGVVRNGTVFSGGIPKNLSEFTAKNPIANHLIVPLPEIVNTKAALNAEGTVEAIAYQRIEKIVKGE